MTARSAPAQLLFAAGLLVSLSVVFARSARADDPFTPQSVPAAPSADVSIADYRTHLTDLISVVQVCAKARDLAHCDTSLVGPDNRVPITEKGQEVRRLVSFAWLRVLLSNAVAKDKLKPTDKSAQTDATQKKTAQESKTPNKGEDAKSQAGNEDSEQKKSAAAQDSANAPASVSDLLEDAVDRLNADLVQAGGTPLPAAAHASARNAMKQVLAGSEFSNLNRRTMRDSLLEQLNDWLNRLLSHLSGSRVNSPWVGRLIFWGFIVLVCLGLAWGLLQLERRWRIRLVPESLAPAAGAASARDWQLWLADARRAAAEGNWREAIHFLYWAAISRLESRRLWPADRARTPREYLALVSADDPRKAGLSALTRSFEHTWYGGRPADEPAYRAAEEMATSLIDGGTR